MSNNQALKIVAGLGILLILVLIVSAFA